MESEPLPGIVFRQFYDSANRERDIELDRNATKWYYHFANDALHVKRVGAPVRDRPFSFSSRNLPDHGTTPRSGLALAAGIPDQPALHQLDTPRSLGGGVEAKPFLHSSNLR